MARELLFQTESGASGDMILAALIDLLACGDEFKDTFGRIGLPVAIDIRDTEKNHLRCKQVTITAPAASHAVTWRDIESFIAATPLSPGIKADAGRIFKTIFAAEAAVHGEDMKDVHLHEVGADDSLIDILGFCWLWEKLERCSIFFTTLVTGRGSVTSRHGILPVPPPAVLRMIQGLACRPGEIEDELLTPTAAAILTTCGRQADANRTVRPLQAGCGCGHKSFPSTPNLLRAMLEERLDGLGGGTAASLRGGAAASARGETVWVLECTMDDITPELLSQASEAIMGAGALDIFIASGLMKKGRPGFQLTVLCPQEARAAVIAAIFAESTAIGLRQRLADRVILDREVRTMCVHGRDVRLKVGSWQGRTRNVKPEFEDLRLLAADLGIPVKEALQMVLGGMHDENGPGQD